MTSMGCVSGICAPLKYHWYEGAGDPLAANVKTTVDAFATVWDSGWLVATSTTDAGDAAKIMKVSDVA